MATDGGLRDRKRRLRKRAIEETALRMFASHGFEATTVDQIATGADISPRTFFHYFASKEDVVLGNFEARFERLIRLLTDRLVQEPPSAAIRAALLEVAEDYEAERDQILQRVQIMLTAGPVQARSLEIQAHWEDRVAETFAVSLGIGPEDPRARVLAGSTLMAMRLAQRRWLSGGAKARLPDLIAETLGVLERGTGDVAGAPAGGTAGSLAGRRTKSSD